jgi:hypothetical protein
MGPVQRRHRRLVLRVDHSSNGQTFASGRTVSSGAAASLIPPSEGVPCCEGIPSELFGEEPGALYCIDWRLEPLTEEQCLSYGRRLFRESAGCSGTLFGTPAAGLGLCQPLLPPRPLQGVFTATVLAVDPAGCNPSALAPSSRVQVPDVTAVCRLFAELAKGRATSLVRKAQNACFAIDRGQVLAAQGIPGDLVTEASAQAGEGRPFSRRELSRPAPAISLRRWMRAAPAGAWSRDLARCPDLAARGA